MISTCFIGADHWLDNFGHENADHWFLDNLLIIGFENADHWFLDIG